MRNFHIVGDYTGKHRFDLFSLSSRSSDLCAIRRNIFSGLIVCNGRLAVVVISAESLIPIVVGVRGVGNLNNSNSQDPPFFFGCSGLFFLMRQPDYYRRRNLENEYAIETKSKPADH